MTTPKVIAVSLSAGVLGGLLAAGVVSPIQAQQRPPAEIRSQSFVLVNPAGNVAGRFGFDSNGNPEIKLLDERGREIWRGGGSQFRPLSELR
jgi:hypothetical protein